MVHHWYPRLLDGEWRERAEAVASRTYDLATYLTEVVGTLDVGARVDAAVTVHDACHGLRILGISSAPRRLLEAAGARIVEMSNPEVCCGFGGTFAEKHPEISGPMADGKLAMAAATDAEYVVSGDTGCLLHLAGRQRRAGVGPKPVHYADLLADGLPVGEAASGDAEANQ